MGIGNETILVVKDSAIKLFFNENNFLSYDVDGILNFLNSHATWELRTSELEEDISLRQIVPYVVVTQKKRLNSQQQILSYFRTNKQTEKRLHNLLSIGFGGHINTEDMKPNQTIATTIDVGGRRELLEEITIDIKEFTPKAIIRSNSTSVDKVHLGLVYEVVVDSCAYEVNESDGIEADWKTLEQLKEDYFLLENWSKIVLQLFI